MPGTADKASSWIVAITACLFVEFIFDGANSYRLSSLFAVVHLVAGAMVVLLIAPGKHFPRVVGPVLAMGAALLAWLPLSWWLGPAHLRESGALGPELSMRLGVGSLFVSGALLGGRRGATEASIVAFAAFGVLWALAGGALTSVHSVLSYQPAGLNMDRWSLTFQNPNVAGVVLAAIALAALDRILALHEQSWRYGIRWISAGWAIGLSAILAILAQTGSRAAMMGVAVAAAIRLHRSRTRIVRSAASIELAVVGLIFLTLIIVLTTTGGLARFAQLAADGNVRLSAWHGYFEATLEHPFFGHGFGSFRQVNTVLLDASNAAQIWNFGAAHNFVLQAAIEGGWVYASACIAWLGLWIWSCVACLRGSPQGGTSWTLGLILGVIIFCALVDIALDVPAVLALFCWFAGILLGGCARSAGPVRRRWEVLDKP